MLKILLARHQQYMNCELPDVQAGFRKGRGTRDQIANICWITEKAREFQKNSYFCFIDYAKAFECVDHNKLWKILKGMGIPDHLTCLLRNKGYWVYRKMHHLKDSLQARWKDPYQVLLASSCVAKLKGIASWIHISN